MYSILLKRCADNIYKCLGIYKDFKPGIEYKEFKNRNLDTKYVYIDVENLDNLDFNVNSVYEYADGLIPYVEKIEEDIDYNTKEYFKKLYDDFEDKNIDDYFWYLLESKSLEARYKKEILNQNSNNGLQLNNRFHNDNQLFWISGDNGFGKTYYLKTLKECSNRPAVIIDCKGIKPNHKRFIDQEIVERIMDSFDGNVTDINNAIIMLDNVDYIKPDDESTMEYMIDIQRIFTNSHGKFPLFSYKYGRIDIYIKNAIIIFTSKIKKDDFIERDEYSDFTKLLNGYMELKFNKEECYKYLNSNVSCLKLLEKYYLVFDTKLVFTKLFVDELVSKVLELNMGYNGFKIILDTIINDDVKNYSEVIFNRFDDIKYNNKKYKVLRNVR